MRSAPTLKIWMTPRSSVAVLEKLALLKIAACKAPALNRTSWRRTSVMTSAVPASPLGIVSSSIFSSIAFSSAAQVLLETGDHFREYHRLGHKRDPAHQPATRANSFLRD